MSEIYSEWTTVQYLAAILVVAIEIGIHAGVPEQQLKDAVNEAAINP